MAEFKSIPPGLFGPISVNRALLAMSKRIADLEKRLGIDSTREEKKEQKASGKEVNSEKNTFDWHTSEDSSAMVEFAQNNFPEVSLGRTKDPEKIRAKIIAHLDTPSQG